MSDIPLVIALLVLTGLLCQWLAWRIRLPAILFLLLAGLLAGPVTGLLSPDDVFGELLMPFVYLSVAIILFEGSLTLRVAEIRNESLVVQRMITSGALVTWVVVGVGVFFLFDFSWQVSALFGAIVIVTGPTVVAPMLRTVRPVRKIANILRWEGIAIDPIGALMAVMTFEFILASAEQTVFVYILQLFFLTLLTGISVGFLMGWILGLLIQNNWMPEYLQNMAALSLVLLAFTLANYLHSEAGLIAVTVMGMWLANRPHLDIYPLLNFKEHLSVLLISLLFIVLAARIDLQQLLAVGGGAILLLCVLQFVARPLKIIVSTWGQDFTWQERALLSWIAPRGIVAAAISAVFADRLVEAGYPEADMLVVLTFSVIVGTVVFQSATSKVLATWLGVAEPVRDGYLIVGANRLGRELAVELKKLHVRCVVVDTHWSNIAIARMAGLETFYGNPVSERAARHLDLTGIGHLLALSHERYLNVISMLHFKADFGKQRVYQIAASGDVPHNEINSHGGGQTSTLGGQLFGKDINFANLLGKLVSGYSFKRTMLSESFTWQDYQNKYGALRIPLFAVSAKGEVKPFMAEKQPPTQAGVTILSLVNSKNE